MTYVVKVWAYQDKEGHPTSDINRALKYEDVEMASLAADVAGGLYSEARECKSFRRERPVQPPKRCKEKGNKSNQSWMRGASS